MPHTVTWIDRLRIEHAVWAVAFRLPTRRASERTPGPNPVIPRALDPSTWPGRPRSRPGSRIRRTAIVQLEGPGAGVALIPATAPGKCKTELSI